MGLDATVYCNCFETGTLKEPPPCLELVAIAPDGSLDCRSENPETLLAFDQWLLHRACEHANGILLHYHIGNLAQVSLLRSELEREADMFPVSLVKILYSGTHSGDCLSLDDVRNVQSELKLLDGRVCLSDINQAYVAEYRQQMTELAEAALNVGKPISF